MMRQFFVSFPRDVEKRRCWTAALRWSRSGSSYVPMALPAMATQGIFVFMGVWNEFMKPAALHRSPENFLLTQGLNAARKQYEKTACWHIIMAGSIVSLLPILLMYIGLNRFFISANDQTARFQMTQVTLSGIPPHARQQAHPARREPADRSRRVLRLRRSLRLRQEHAVAFDRRP